MTPFNYCAIVKRNGTNFSAKVTNGAGNVTYGYSKYDYINENNGYEEAAEKAASAFGLTLKSDTPYLHIDSKTRAYTLVNK